MGKSDWLLIGKVTGVHGLAGNLKIWSFAESPDTFAKGRQIRICEQEHPDIGTDYTIARAWTRKKGMRLALIGVDTRNAAEQMVGQQILINKNDLPELEQDTWYWQDLMGLTVQDLHLGVLGTVDHLFETGAHDILVVKGQMAFVSKEILIPMSDQFVADVDLAGKQITTDLPDGYILD